MSDNTRMRIPETGYMRIKEVLQFIPIGRSTWWLWVADGKAPSPIKLGPRTTAWKAEDIKRLIETLAEEKTK